VILAPLGLLAPIVINARWVTSHPLVILVPVVSMEPVAPNAPMAPTRLAMPRFLVPIAAQVMALAMTILVFVLVILITPEPIAALVPLVINNLPLDAGKLFNAPRLLVPVTDFVMSKTENVGATAITRVLIVR